MREHLKAFHVLVLAGLVGVALATAAGVWELIVAAPIHTTVFVDAANAVGLPEDIRADEVSEVGVVIGSPTGRQRLLYALTQAPTTILLLVVLAMLAALLRRARRTDPFTPQTVRSLRLMGVGIDNGGRRGRRGGRGTAAPERNRHAGQDRGRIGIPFVWLLGGFVCFAIAEVVNRGCAMRDELATVI